MAVKLKDVVPFGRSLAEYRDIFSLTDADLGKRIISVADGPASVNADAAEQGLNLISADPIYGLEAEAIRDRFYAVVDDIMAQIHATPDDWVWEYYDSPEALRASRERATERFAGDFPKGKSEGRYVEAALPTLPFEDGEFDLALCSHFLFLYSQHFDLEFHYASVREIMRIAPEARIFPLLTLDLKPSPYVDAVRSRLAADGFTTTVEKVRYEIQKGGNQMLVVRR